MGEDVVGWGRVVPAQVALELQSVPPMASRLQVSVAVSVTGTITVALRVTVRV